MPWKHKLDSLNRISERLSCNFMKNTDLFLVLILPGTPVLFHGALMICVFMAELSAKSSLRCSCRAQAPPQPALTGLSEKQEESSTAKEEVASPCHSGVKKLTKLLAVMETNVGDTVGPSHP